MLESHVARPFVCRLLHAVTLGTPYKDTASRFDAPQNPSKNRQWRHRSPGPFFPLYRRYETRFMPSFTSTTRLFASSTETTTMSFYIDMRATTIIAWNLQVSFLLGLLLTGESISLTFCRRFGRTLQIRCRSKTCLSARSSILPRLSTDP
jgi:hypothetical protein